MKREVRSDWTKEEISEIYNLPLLELVFRAQTVHRQFHEANKVQLCTLLSIKTGGCPEDCKYCAQSSRNQTSLKAEPLLTLDTVIQKANEAKASGSTRFCMGAAWRQVRDSNDFEKVIDMIKAVKAMGLEPCVTLGMLTYEQALRLKEAGLYAYNHNLDTSENFYKEIITTRTYQDRLDTIENVRKAGITVCCGGILGMGETDQDRIDLIHTLATLAQHPESVPINALVPISGTPLQQVKPIEVWPIVRSVATARITMPMSMVRLSAGRRMMSGQDHALLFLAGANSIHTGEKLLTTQNSGNDRDMEIFDLLGLEPFAKKECGDSCNVEEVVPKKESSSCCRSSCHL